MNEGELLSQLGDWTRAARLLVETKANPSRGELRRAIRDVQRALMAERRIQQSGEEVRDGSKKQICNGSDAEPRPLWFLNNSLPHTQSGYTLRTQESLNALARLNIQVSGVTRLGYPLVVGKLPTNMRESVDGISYSRILPLRYPRTLEERFQTTVESLVAEATRWHCNVIHTTTDFSNAQVAAEAANRLGLPWVYEVRGELHNTWLSKIPEEYRGRASQSERYRVAQRQELNAMKAADAIVAISEISKEKMVSRGIPSEKIFVIPNGVDSGLVGLNYDKVKLRDSLGLPHCRLVGTASSLVDYEGLDDLIRAVALDQEMMGVIVGEGVARPDLERLARSLGVEDRLIFVGRVSRSEVWRWYAALDVFVLPRKNYEVCRTVTPVKGLIAQALGKPIVASDLPPLREVTGGFATFAQPGDPRDLISAIHTELETFDSGKRERSIEWASRHTWDSNAIRYRELYKQIRELELRG